MWRNIPDLNLPASVKKESTKQDQISIVQQSMVYLVLHQILATLIGCNEPNYDNTEIPHAFGSCKVPLTLVVF